MEQNFRSELSEELHEIDVESLKLDTVIQLRAWQKHMYALVDRTYKARLNDIDTIADQWTNEIEDTQKQIKNSKITDRKSYMQLKHDVDLLKSKIRVIESMPENLQTRIDQTVRVARETKTDDEPVLVDFDDDDNEQMEMMEDADDEEAPEHHEEQGRVSKIFHSEPVQRSIATGVVKAIAQIGVVTATSTTTVAATTMAKTAIIATVCGVGTVAYGVGKIAFGTTRRVWSWAVSSDE